MAEQQAGDPKRKRKSREERLATLDARAAVIQKRLNEIRRRKARIESDAKRAARKRLTRGKIICGGLAQAYLADNPKDRWFREFMREGLRKNPATKEIPELLAFYKSLGPEPK